MFEAGYYRYPTLHEDSIVFVCEDALWSVAAKGGAARRLTANDAKCSFPRFSPDGSMVAFSGTHEGQPDVYLIPSSGGTPKRLTYLGGSRCIVNGWSQDGQRVFFTDSARYAADGSEPEAYSVSVEGGTPRALNYGHMFAFSIRKDGAALIGRNDADPARWKRYRGGMCGEIWVDANGKGIFNRLIQLKGNMVWPMWVGDRVYFLSDHDGIGNIYSCLVDGSDLQQHTQHTDYYVRFPSTDGKRIVYTAGADIYIFDPETGKSKMVNVQTPSTTAQLDRKFVPILPDFFEHWSPHPNGHSLALIGRGQPFTMANWEGAPLQHGSGSRVRYRLAEWLTDGARFVVVNDAAGFEQLEIHHANQSKPPKTIDTGDIGRVDELLPAPGQDLIALTNHRCELWLVNPKARGKKAKLLDSSDKGRITGLAWSPDGRWIAYAYPVCRDGSTRIRVADTRTRKLYDVTEEVRRDYAPTFDASGNYLFFLSDREYIPVDNGMTFDYSFPVTTRPYVVPLRKDVASPFTTDPRPVHDGDYDKPGKRGNSTLPQEPAQEVIIHFDGISSRVVPFPDLPTGDYGQIISVPGRVFVSQFDPLQAASTAAWMGAEAVGGSLLAYDFDKEHYVVLSEDVVSMRLSSDYRSVYYETAQQDLRVFDGLDSELLQNGLKDNDEYSRYAGWINIERVEILVNPQDEWRQMYVEAWRLQKEHFWDANMSGIDWDLVHERYACLLPRVRTRSEFSDLIWEMQGELGTSHAYEKGGEYPATRDFSRGFLGAELSWLGTKKGYRINKIIRGDCWDEANASPLAAPGLNLNEGDIILSVGGQPVSRQVTVEELLLKKQVVTLSVLDSKGTKRNVTVKTLPSEEGLRYRAWVEANRKYVHDKTEGKIGYVHIPDMDVKGYAEFFRGYLKESDREGLIVDVRDNGGGNVSQLILRMLTRRPISYDVPRWMQPQPYPDKAIAGPIVAVTNQFAGSDGDIFSHSFKLLKIGTLIGKRTWGGVIGISPTHSLVDGTTTTQPEFSTWFADAGWGIENHGAEPDIEVDITPQDYKAGLDPQLDKAIEVALKDLADNPPSKPDFGNRPNLCLPPTRRSGRRR